jgi:hypothetical protein
MNETKTFEVTVRFQHPAHDERDGVALGEFIASNKTAAIKAARRQADHDGHLSGSTKGLAWFRAVEVIE